MEVLSIENFRDLKEIICRKMCFFCCFMDFGCFEAYSNKNLLLYFPNFLLDPELVSDEFFCKEVARKFYKKERENV